MSQHDTRNDNYWRLAEDMGADPNSIEREPARYLLVEEAHGSRTSPWFVTCEAQAAINAYLRSSFDPWERMITEIHDLDTGERLSFELDMRIVFGEPVTRYAACPFCSKVATLHRIDGRDGTAWWACKNALGLTCFEAWARVVMNPPVFRPSDF